MSGRRESGRDAVRLLSICHHQGGAAATEALADLPPDQVMPLAKFLLGALYAATDDLACVHGVTVEQFLRTMAFNIETEPQGKG